MTQNLTKLSIRTESNVPDLNGQSKQFLHALQLAVAAGDILDQVKRKMFYRRDYDETKLADAFERLNELSNQTMGDFLALQDDGAAPSVCTRISHAVAGVVTEGTELATAMIDYLRTGKVDAVNLFEEAADTKWYLNLLGDEIGYTDEKLDQLLIAKLSARYSEKFSEEAAVLRDIGTEREVMERFLEESSSRS